MKLSGIDHMVLTVASIETTVSFYTQVLGFTPVTFGDNRRALHGGNQKINLHPLGAELKPHATHPTAGSGDICLVYEGDIQDIIAHLIDCEVAIEEGPVLRTGALGPIESVYIRDPDGNLIELSVYRDKGVLA